MKNKKKKIIILGGGLTGLAAADKLCDKYDITILEKQNQLGGLAASFDHEGKWIPMHYHHVFDHDYITQSYLKRFGLFNDMAWKKIRMAICVNKKKYNFTEPIGLLTFDYLSLLGRLRYALFGAYVLKLMNPSKIPEKIDARQWLYKYAGKEVADKLFYQLQGRNKFGIPLEDISAKQFAHRLKAGEVMGKFGYPRKGLKLMIDRFEEDLLRNGIKIIQNAKATEIDTKNKTITCDGKKIKYDALINTIPIPEMLKITTGLPKGYIAKLSKIKYCPCVTVVFGTRRFLSKHYWLNILKERVHMIMQHSILFDGYDTKVSWALRYGNSGEDLPLSEEEIKKIYLGVVKKFFPSVEISWSKVFKERYASPIYDKDYPRFKPDFRSPVEGFYNAGIAVSYPKIRNMNTALDSGLKIAGMISHDHP